MKELKDYSVDEVCVWLNAIGLGNETEPFRTNAVDGKMLLTLTMEDLTGELGLTNLQARKVLQSIETQNEMAAGQQEAAAPAAAEQPDESPSSPKNKNEHEVLEGAAGGAAMGALGGAVYGAVLGGDPGEMAGAGAAAGAATGAAGGLVDKVRKGGGPPRPKFGRK